MTEGQSAINLEQNETIRIPPAWKEVKLQELLTLLRNGLVKKQNKDGKGYPITRIETISDEKIDITKVGYIEHITQNEINLYKLTEGDILFSHINSLVHIGKTAIYDGKPSALLHGMNLLILRPNKSFVFPMFLLYKLRYLRMKDLFRNIAKKAVNQASINQTELGKVGFLLPPLPEQGKIAEILGTVDEAIGKVEQAIEKTERLKKGLMQELLTGKRRVKESKGQGVIESREYKETEIGRIPKGWEVVRILDIGEVVTGTTPSTKVKEYWGEGYPFVTPTDFSDSKYVYGTERSVTLKGAKAARLIPNDSVMVTCIASVGEVSIASKVCITNQQINTIVFSKEIDSHYVYYTMLFRKKILKRWAGITTSPIIKKSLFEQFPLPLPPLCEQRKIAEILGTVDKRVELLKEKKQKFERIKKGLMNDLLTGRKRVKV